jgi:hypothetical protein
MNYRAETQNALKRVRKWSQPAEASFMCLPSNEFDGMARNLWVPAINNHGGFGRWAFIEITDPWDAKNTIRATL